MYRGAGYAIFVGFTGILAACATPQSGPQPTVKQVVETAPADLQLACSAQTSKKFPNSGNVLPLNSELLGGDVYRIHLTSQGGNYVCDINKAGIILSLLPATDPVVSAVKPGTG